MSSARDRAETAESRPGATSIQAASDRLNNLRAHGASLGYTIFEQETLDAVFGEAVFIVVLRSTLKQFNNLDDLATWLGTIPPRAT